MTPAAAAFIVAITELVLKYGVPAAVKIIQEWEVKNPTAADFQALAKMARKPETYFEDEQ